MEFESFWAMGSTGKHHGGWLHGNPKAKSTGKHAKPVKAAKPAKGGKAK